MLEKRWRAKLVKTMGIQIVIFFGLFYSSIMLIRMGNASEVKNDTIMRDLNIRERKLQYFVANKDRLNNVYNDWVKLKSNQKYVGDVDLAELNEHLRDLRMKYKLTTLDTKVGVPQKNEHDSIPGADVVDIDINIKFAAASDEYGLQFLESLMNKIPGYLIVKNVTIKKQTSITDRHIEQAEKGTFLPIFQGELSFSWKKVTLY